MLLWLEQAYHKLNAAVFTTYSGPIVLRDDDTLSVARLRVLDLKRAATTRAIKKILGGTL